MKNKEVSKLAKSFWSKPYLYTFTTMAIYYAVLYSLWYFGYDSYAYQANENLIFLILIASLPLAIIRIEPYNKIYKKDEKTIKEIKELSERSSPFLMTVLILSSFSSVFSMSYLVENNAPDKVVKFELVKIERIVEETKGRNPSQTIEVDGKLIKVSWSSFSDGEYVKLKESVSNDGLYTKNEICQLNSYCTNYRIKKGTVWYNPFDWG